ncbi:AAA family ATPase [Cryptosporangium phraense]|uniref:AAA family ATPase n=1 Tax=Cryptosporangium phraense TaxID=2593070 RepID=UPI00197A76B8|nr:AAA family ATPase [Cryptosporangium phraense]
MTGAARRPGSTPPSDPTPPAPTQAGPKPPRPGAVQRPGGSWYYPRELTGGRLDVDVLRDLRVKQLPVLLYGPPGTGKTALAEAAYGADLITVTGTGDATIDDFLGGYVAEPDGSFTFTYGPLVEAMRGGKVLFVDDGTLIPPRVLAVLYPAMDGRGRITIPAYRNEPVHAQPGFYVLFGHNPGVHGAVLTEALASRLRVHIEVTTDFRLAASLGVPLKAREAALRLNEAFARGEIGWAPQLRELIGFRDIATALGPDAAVSNLLAITPEEDRPVVRGLLSNVFGHPVTPLTLGDQR